MRKHEKNMRERMKLRTASGTRYRPCSQVTCRSRAALWRWEIPSCRAPEVLKCWVRWYLMRPRGLLHGEYWWPVKGYRLDRVTLAPGCSSEQSMKASKSWTFEADFSLTCHVPRHGLRHSSLHHVSPPFALLQSWSCGSLLWAVVPVLSNGFAVHPWHLKAPETKASDFNARLQA